MNHASLDNGRQGSDFESRRVIAAVAVAQGLHPGVGLVPDIKGLLGRDRLDDGEAIGRELVAPIAEGGVVEETCVRERRERRLNGLGSGDHGAQRRLWGSGGSKGEVGSEI